MPYSAFPSPQQVAVQLASATTFGVAEVDGTSITSASGVLSATGTFSGSRHAVADASVSIATTDRIVAYTSITAARTATLPAASAFPTGTLLVVVDESGSCSLSNTITVSRAGADTIASPAGSAATSFVLNGAFASVILESNGSNKWTVVNQSTLALLGQVSAGGATVTPFSLATGSFTVDFGKGALQFITNGGAFTITAPAADGSCEILVTNNATAGAITFTGFTVNANTGEPLTTTNGNKFIITIVRINGVSTYSIKALQ